MAEPARDQSDLARIAIAWVLVAGLALLGLAPLVPPKPPGISSDGSAPGFSTDRAFRHIEAIAVDSRPIGSTGNERARNAVLDELSALGLETVTQTIEVPDYYRPSGAPVPVTNVIARMPGTASTGSIALVGHLDTVPETPGANDDASAIAIMLEVARVLTSDTPPRNDVLFIFTDGEEPAPRYGSTAFLNTHPLAAQIGFVVNLEALGRGGPSLVTAANGASAWVTDRLEALPYPAAFSFVTAVVDLIGGSNTDFAPFRDRGIAGVEMAYLHGSSIYHTPGDTPEEVRRRSLYQQGANTLALVQEVAGTDLEATRDESSTVFFPAGRHALIRFQSLWVYVALVAGAIALVAVARVRTSPWRVVLSAGQTLGRSVLAAIAGTLVWLVIARLRSSMGIVESYVYLGVLIIGAYGYTAGLLRARPRPPASLDTTAGVVLLWWTAGLLATLIDPQIGYLFVFPALAASLALLWWAPGEGPAWPNLAALALAVGTAIMLVGPPIDTFYQFVQPRPGNPDSQLFPVVAVPVLLVALIGALAGAFHVGNGRSSRPAPITSSGDPADRSIDPSPVAF